MVYLLEHILKLEMEKDGKQEMAFITQEKVEKTLSIIPCVRVSKLSIVSMLSLYHKARSRQGIYVLTIKIHSSKNIILGNLQDVQLMNTLLSFKPFLFDSISVFFIYWV